MYLTRDDITHYLQASRDEGKMLIATDACGAGKTRAMIDWVAANPDWSVVIVVERKDQAEKRQSQLLQGGVPESDIAIVNSDHPVERDRKYADGLRYSKRICIITHARLWMDPPQLWTCYRYKRGNILLIDEILMEPSRSVRVNIGFLSIISTYVGFNVAKYRNCFDKDFDPTDLRDITPNDQETILRYLSLLYAKLMDAAQQGKDIKGDILEGVSEPEKTGMRLDMPERIAYFACLMAYSILMGKTQEIPGSQVRSVTVISPLLLWSHEFDASALFDGTGEFFPYPKDSCTIAPATIPPRQVLDFKLLPVSGNKLKHRKEVEKSPERYYPRMEKLFSSILTALAAKYQQIYVCTWKDKISDPYEHRTWVPMSPEVRIEKITHIEDEHHFDIEPVLKFERFLKTLVEKLKLSDRVFVSHYGLTRGSNQFISFDCVLLVGNFYYPSFAYDDLSTFSKIFSLFKQTSAPTYDGEALPILLSHLIQECLRTRARRGKLVDCYLCLDATDRDYKEIFGGLQTLQELGYYVNSIEASDLNGEVVASEYLVKFQYIIRDLLTKKQESRMVKLAETYPELLKNRELYINTVELGHLWDCRSNDICPILQTIMERSKTLIAYQILESGKQGRHNSTKLKIYLRSIEQ